MIEVKTKGKTIAILTGLGVVALVGCVFAFRGSLVERWYLWKLESGGEAERAVAVRTLTELGSNRAVPYLVRMLSDQQGTKSNLVALRALLEIAGIGSAEQGHAYCKLLLEEKSKAFVVKTLGEPREKRTSDFAVPMYGSTDDFPEFDEQWIYTASLERVLIYFKRGKVTLAIDEWSDW